MTAQDFKVRLRNVQALRDAIRRAIHQTRVSLDMPDSLDADNTVLEALRDVSQAYELRRDGDIDVTLNEPRCPPDLANAVDWLTGKGSR